MVDGAPAAMTLSAAVFWSLSLSRCEPGEEEVDKQHSCRAVSLQEARVSNTLSLSPREIVSEFQKGPPLQNCRTVGSGRIAKYQEEREVKATVRNIQFCLWSGE